jgi:hypothetical protein
MLAAIPAFAEDIVAYQVDGDAPVASTDARLMALDEAFAAAVTAALSELVAPEVRTARKGELDKEIIGRARLWVAKFSVTKDETLEDRRQLNVSVRIDRDKVRARLTELNVAIKDAATSTATHPVDNSAPPARTGTILLRVATPSGVRVDWGANAVKDLPGLSALTSVLRTNGYAVRRAPSTGPAPGTGELPVSDEDADVLAAEAKAELVAVASVTVGAPVPVRGLPTTASLVTAALRVIDRKDRRALGQATASAAARGDDAGYAIDRALLGAAADVFPPAPAKLDGPRAFSGDDVPLAEAGIVLVRLPARTPFALVLLEQKYLAGAKGVRAATVRRLSPSGWVIGVATSEPVEQVARIAKKAPSSDTSASVKIVGDLVELSLQGATP